MTLIRPDLNSPSDLDRWIRDFFWGTDPFSSLRSRLLQSGVSSATLAADFYEEPDAYHVVMELPGVKKENVQVELENAVLRVSGKHVDEGQEDQDHSYEFQRALGVPENVRSDQVKAELKDGLLHVTMPKPEESKPRTISVQ